MVPRMYTSPPTQELVSAQHLKEHKLGSRESDRKQSES